MIISELRSEGRADLVRSDRKPHLRLLDANELQIDDRELRLIARTLSTTCGSEYVSRSYSFPYALVAIHDRAVGVDVERVSTCNSLFADLICTREERVEVACESDPDRLLTSLWSSKEALAKGLGDALQYEPSRLEAPARWPESRAGAWSCEEVIIDSAHVAWVCWRR